MRILVGLKNFPFGFSGQEIFDEHVVRGLLERRHEVALACRTLRNSPLPSWASALTVFSWQDASARCPEWRPDVAVLLGAKSSSALWKTLDRQEIPYVLYCHNIRFNRFYQPPFASVTLRAWARRRGFNHAAFVLCISRFTQGQLVRAGIAADRMEVCHPGVDLAAFVPDPEVVARVRKAFGLEGKSVVLTVSRMRPGKGHLDFLAAFQHVAQARPDVLWVIVGGGPLEETTHRCAKEIGIPHQVVLAGQVPHDEKVALLHLSDVFAFLPTQKPARGGAEEEPFGIVYLEAGASAKPVVGSVRGAGPEIIANEETGLLVEPTDRKAVVHALLRLLDSPEDRMRMGRAGFERVSSQFSWERCIREIEERLDAAAGATRRPASDTIPASSVAP